MKAYKIVTLRGGKTAAAPRKLHTDSDDEAVELAVQIACSGDTVEVWRGFHLVARLAQRADLPFSFDYTRPF